MTDPMVRRDILKARRLVERYNRETLALEKLEDRLYRLNQKHDRTETLAFAYLPREYGISLGHGAPLEITGPYADNV